jgi:hypothetical protein
MSAMQEQDRMAHARQNAKAWFESIEEMLIKLQLGEQDEDDRAGCAADDARREIEESVLSVAVRDAWRSPGQPTEDGPDEYEILLSTGGPALRIWGKLGKRIESAYAD